MATFRTVSKSTDAAKHFELELQAQGYRERPGAARSSLEPREYRKQTGTSNPNSFGGEPVVTFEIREAV